MTRPHHIKILIAGGFGAGKTTLVGTVSDIPPLITEETITTESAGTDDLTATPTKTSTTVGVDFGRIALTPAHTLFMFGLPGQPRFWSMWTELSAGALGAVVIADPRNLDACFDAIDFCENQGIEFVVALNMFHDAPAYPTDDVKEALVLAPDVPVLTCDVRHRPSATTVLAALIQHLIRQATRQFTKDAP